MLDTKALAEATATIVREHVAAAVEPLLARIAALETRQPEKGEPGEKGDAGRDGKDADMAAITAHVERAVAEQVERAVAALPAPEKGEPGEKGDPGEKGERGEKGDPGADGKDGAGIADLLIDRDDNLVATMTDGRMKSLGRVVGRDGKDGEPGRDGKDGRDGRDLDDIHVTQTGSVVEFAFQIGEEQSIYEIELPAGPPGQDGKDAYPGEARGLYDPEAVYRAMDVVSHNGSEWRAKVDDPGELPGPGWMLSACKGKRGDRGERGAQGKAGASVVASYVSGSDLIITLDDGTEVKADLNPLIQG